MTTDTITRENEIVTPREPRWWLVQRYSAIAPDDVHPTRQGVSRILSGDYMGSAEFEWGAVPKTWRRMRLLADRNMLVRHETPWHTKNGTPVYVLMPTWLDAESVFQKIFEIALDKHHLKEPAYMNVWLDTQDDSRVPSSDRTDAWLLINENDPVPVFWTVQSFVMDALYSEITKRIGVQADELRMFDTHNFEHAGRTISGQVRGIYEHHALMQTANGQQQNVPYGQIWSGAK